MPSNTTAQIHITPAENGYYVTCIPPNQQVGVRWVANSLADVHRISKDFTEGTFKAHSENLKT